MFPEKDADLYVKRAQVAYRLREYERAIAQYGEALRIKPDHALAYLGRGNAYIAAGEVELAIVDHSHALRLSANLAQDSELHKVPPKERAAAGIRLAKMGDPRPGVMSVDEMELCFVPAGAFWMGASAEHKEARHNAKPCHQLSLDAYWISRYPITNAQFGQFVEDGGYANEVFWAEAKAHGVWKDGQIVKAWIDSDSEPRAHPYNWGEPFNLPNHPVVGINWYEALAFTRWLTERWGCEIKLPNEAEWEKAARGGIEIPLTPLIRPASTRGRGGAPAGHDKGAHPQGMIRGRNDVSAFSVPQDLPMMPNPLPQRRYPWGNHFEEGRVNIRSTGIGHTTAVGAFIGDKSPYGCEEMTGNVWEWTRSLYQPYPYQLHERREKLDASLYTYRTVRGRAWVYDSKIDLGCSLREWDVPYGRDNCGGFRVLHAPSI